MARPTRRVGRAIVEHDCTPSYMSTLVPAVISGISVGLLYGLLGFSVVTLYKSSATLSFAQPAIGMFTVFIGYEAYSKWGLTPLEGAGFGAVGAVILGALIYLIAMRPNDDAGGSNRAFRTLAIYGLLIAIATAAFSNGQPFTFPIPMPSGSVGVAGGRVPDVTFVTLGVALLLGGGFVLFFRRTRYGVLFRAVADDRDVAQLLGIRARRITALVWIAGTLIAYIVGMLTVTTGFVSTDTLGNYAIYAMAGVFVGGLSVWMGTFLGGIIVGVISNVALVYLAQEWAVGAVFIALLVTLMIRPQGILGTEAATRV